MSRHSVAGRSTVAGTAARGIASIFSAAAVGFRLREVGIFNTTTTACAAALVRFTNTTGQGAALTEAEWDAINLPAVTGFAGHTADAGIGDVLAQCSLGAAIGAGMVWTFGEMGIVVPVGTSNGLGVTCPTGTGQVLDYYFVWDE